MHVVDVSMLGLLLCAFRVIKWRHWKIEGPCLDSQSFPSLLLWKHLFSGHTVIDVGYWFLCWFIRYKMWRRGFDSPLVLFESSHPPPAVWPSLGWLDNQGSLIWYSVVNTWVSLLWCLRWLFERDELGNNDELMMSWCWQTVRFWWSGLHRVYLL